MMTAPGAEARPWGITALSVFFVAGAIISFVSGVSLALPGSVLEPMWRLNPRAREAFAGMGAGAILLLGAVCLACALAAVGLWRSARWGHRLAVGILVVNLLGDVANTVLGTERRAVFGIPVVLAILAFLWSGRVRSFFRHAAAARAASGPVGA